MTQPPQPARLAIARLAQGTRARGSLARRALAALALAAAAALPAAAGTACGPSPVAGMQRCVTGLPSGLLAALPQLQQASQWCWAAGVSMLLRRYGVEVPQQEIVKTRLGELSDQPAAPRDIVDLLNRRWADASGQAVQMAAQPLAPWWRQQGLVAPPVLQELESARPLMLLGSRHAVLLVQLVYDREQAGGATRLVRAVVIDPAQPGGLRSLRPAEQDFDQLLRVAGSTPAAASGNQLAQHVRQDAAVAVVVDLDRRVDAQGGGQLQP